MNFRTLLLLIFCHLFIATSIDSQQIRLVPLHASEQVQLAEKSKSEKKDSSQSPQCEAQKIELEGVPNFYQIDDHIYRCAQPTDKGFQNLEKFGIKTIINLRNFHSDDDEARGTKLNLERIRFNTWRIKEQIIIDAMLMLEDKTRGPFVIHCMHGADRTGLICAMYRMLYQDWSKEEALAELTSDKFGYHAIWANIPKYIKNVDLKELKRKIAQERQARDSRKKE